ncbi:MAG: hypothetical protein A3B25_00150 [Candidatus Ryanbacteria bacterium RIFCSPLOWO2_01_FULL_48_26]|uniref:Rhodanese domain-containing protein n=1 Tax=Candidatus Ryanbacteria bacterium RIFCSPLOWO2_01_FULL_48_26 TaxID=1802126 RepID=A0A1G2GTJ1_9BACT|nr:MAG: hypothetical protein A3B25_00150 [Candidatus Ryanbacteria bacterium RIFCSPLOWO2_01_FULL_48_26]
MDIDSVNLKLKEHSQAAAPHNIPMSRPGKRIGIIGNGYVGGTIAGFYRQTGADVKVYDKYKESDPLEEVLAQDYIFIAVPTNHVEGQGMDFSMLDDAMQNASRSRARAIIIKSTVLPGTTARYQKQYPNIKIIFNPEFLTELTAYTDFQYPDRQLVGYTDASYDIAAEIQELLPLAPFTRIMPAEAAEMAKFFGNTWFAVKVVFANQMYDLCQTLGIDYETVRDGVAADRRIGRSHLDVLHGGYRGYGGKCLPKDTRALIDFAESLGLDLKLLKMVEELNRELTGGVDR